MAPARAQSGILPPQALRLPVSLFARHAVIQARPAGNQVADGATQLHAIPFEQLGRLSGYLETIWWWSRSRPGARTYLMSIQYAVSRFPTADAAAAAYGDARTTLFEAGAPLHSSIAGQPVFAVTERSGRGDAYTLLRQGPLYLELHLRYPAGADGTLIKNGLWYLWRAGSAAVTLARAYVNALPPPTATPAPPPPPSPPPAPTAPTPSPTPVIPGATPVVPGATPTPSLPTPTPTPATPITPPPVATPATLDVAPFGTGPVTKSPSLMALDAPQVQAPALAQLVPGSNRPSSGPPLMTRAAPPVDLVPSDFLSRYAQTANVTSGSLYDSIALYPDTTQADAAFAALVARNQQLGLQSYPLAGATTPTFPLASADAVASWQGAGDVIIAFRAQNVIMVVAETWQRVLDPLSLAGRLILTVPTWLHAQGTSIVDARGNPVQLSCLNWYGMEQEDFVVGGLDFQPYENILLRMTALGYNCVRLPFSNQMVEQNPVVTAHIGANPELSGLHALDILDRIVSFAGAIGLSVILDNHRSEAGWSAEQNGLWYTANYPTVAFLNDWVTMSQRYQASDAVIGADLRNEPHGAATWGGGNPATDWRAAADEAGDAVLSSDPHILIIVEGIQSNGNSGSYWWGGNLTGVANAPVEIHFADGSSAHSQLVYSIHDYGPNNCHGGCPWFNPTTSYDSLAQLWDQQWGYITADPSQPYAAPVFIGEFGTCNYAATCVTDTASGSQGQWFSSLVQYIAAKHVGWAYWSANATQSTAPPRVYGALDWYGFFDSDWSSPCPWIDTALHSIGLGAVPAGGSPPG